MSFGSPQIGAGRNKHRFERPFKMPTARCICGAKVSAPEDMGIVRQRDFALDWFNIHRAAEAAKRRLARAKR